MLLRDNMCYRMSGSVKPFKNRNRVGNRVGGGT